MSVDLGVCEHLTVSAISKPTWLCKTNSSVESQSRYILLYAEMQITEDSASILHAKIAKSSFGGLGCRFCDRISKEKYSEMKEHFIGLSSWKEACWLRIVGVVESASVTPLGSPEAYCFLRILLRRSSTSLFPSQDSPLGLSGSSHRGLALILIAGLPCSRPQNGN